MLQAWHRPAKELTSDGWDEFLWSYDWPRLPYNTPGFDSILRPWITNHTKIEVVLRRKTEQDIAMDATFKEAHKAGFSCPDCPLDNGIKEASKCRFAVGNKDCAGKT